MTSADQDPAAAPGLEPGGGVRPGDTPPTAGQLSGATGGRRDDAPNVGPVAGNRTPMVIALVLIGLLVVAVLGYGIAQVASYVSGDAGQPTGRAGRLSTATAPVTAADAPTTPTPTAWT